MSENYGRLDGRRYHARRAIGAGAGLGALAAVLLMMISPLAAAGAAHPNVSKGIFVPSTSWSTSGCSTAKAHKPTFSLATGVGGWSGSASATTCKHALLGVGGSSYGSASSELQAVIPLKLTASTSGVNVTWSLNVAWSEKASGGSTSGCKAVRSGNYSYYDTYISSWVNTTDYSGYCSQDASATLSGYAYIIDTTTQSEFGPSNYWYGAGASFSHSNNSYGYVTTYSNPSQWQNNYSYSYSYGYARGASGSGVITPASSPTWYINGTFSGTDKYVLVAYIDNQVNADISNLKGATTSASINAAGASNYEDLHYVVW